MKATILTTPVNSFYLQTPGILQPYSTVSTMVDKTFHVEEHLCEIRLFGNRLKSI